MSSLSSPQTLEDTLRDDSPFLLLKHQDHPEPQLFSGDVASYDKLADIPRSTGTPGSGARVDTVSAIPFNQIRECGYPAHGDEKIRCIQVQHQHRIPLQQLLSTLPREQIVLRDGIRYSPGAKEYEALNRAIIIDEIGNGEGANFVTPLKAEGEILDMSHAKALSIFRSLLEQEFGAYAHFLMYDGDRYFIGASPERHLTVRDGIVQMNPISGTLRKRMGELSLPGFKEDLTAFLQNEKEIMELFMVLDEELKMMSQMCERGGTVQGPLLKEMSRLVHTEYLLTGKSDKDIIDLFRTSMFAPTVSGSPIGNACRIICKYEPESRRYYAGAIALIGREADGSDSLDSAINIRAVEISKDGRLVARAGSTLVRDSDPAEEVREAVGKLSAMIASIQRVTGQTSRRLLPEIMNDPTLQSMLVSRNDRLSPYSLKDQEAVDNTVEELRGKPITVIGNGDDFSHTLKHMITSMGAVATVVPFDEYDLANDVSDIVIVGPGPGDPNDQDSEKMHTLRGIVASLRKTGKPFLGVCLGHQILSHSLGMPVEKKADPQQGVQRTIDLFGSAESVGFYNAFSATHRDILGVESAHDPETGEVHALRGPTFASMQFHPESVLSKNGYRILTESLVALRAKPASPSLR